jgi:membrane associated rhomboid family serine protease
MTLGAGALGNLVTLFLRTSSPILSLGASTAVFGALGALSAMPGVFRGRQRWLPLVTGIVILGLYGAGDARTDVLAHVCGFVAGWVVGRLHLLVDQRVHPGRIQDSTRLFVACVVPVLAWLWALS